MKNEKWDNKRIALLGLFASLAIIFGYVESLIPPIFGTPGIKLGLANLAILFILYRYTFVDAFLVSVIRIFVIGFMFSSLSSIMYSLAGAILSMAVMLFLLRKTDFSLIGVSVAGSVMHNVGQLLLAMCVVESTNLIYYAPALLVAGVGFGFLIGIATQEISKRIHL